MTITPGGSPFDPSDSKPRCVHCKRRTARDQSRCLCNTCYQNRSTRDRYPAKGRVIRHATEEELDALIAEQRKPENLPSWWPKSPQELQQEMETDDEEDTP